LRDGHIDWRARRDDVGPASLAEQTQFDNRRLAARFRHHINAVPLCRTPVGPTKLTEQVVVKFEWPVSLNRQASVDT
jgi:hypothetical protein